eukprot:tig00001021_g6301.t1
MSMKLEIKVDAIERGLTAALSSPSTTVLKAVRAASPRPPPNFNSGAAIQRANSLPDQEFKQRHARKAEAREWYW